MTVRTKTRTARAAQAVTGDNTPESILGTEPVRPFQWVRVVAGAISALFTGVGIAAAFGWITEFLMVATATLTGSMVAGIAIYYLGIALMVVTAFYTLPKVWDAVCSGRAEDAISAGVARLGNLFKRTPVVAA